jgi:hypothetical protein
MLTRFVIGEIPSLCRHLDRARSLILPPFLGVWLAIGGFANVILSLKALLFFGAEFSFL